MAEANGDEQERGSAPSGDELERQTAAARSAWEAKAAWWDGRFGEDTNLLVRPAVERLLDVAPGERLLEVACGNGAFARRLAALGATVLAIDFSPAFLRLARERTAGTPGAERIAYREVDATRPAQLAALAAPQDAPFDAAVCIMGLMDMATIDPLLEALTRLLRPGGRFVFTVTHPCFNHTGAVKTIAEEDREGELVVTAAVQVRHYLTPRATRGAGAAGEPVAHPYFERPLHVLLASAFRAGFVLDGLEEPGAGPAPDPERLRPTSWHRFPEIPMFLVARLRRPPRGD